MTSKRPMQSFYAAGKALAFAELGVPLMLGEKVRCSISKKSENG
jgi:hypothetical protein